MATSQSKACLSRRRMLQLLGATAAGGISFGCGSNGSVGSTPSSPSPSSSPQTAPSGAFTEAQVTVAASGTGSIGPQFVGLSYEKVAMTEPFFTGGNTELIGLFTGLGKSLLRVGGDSVDKMTWTPNGPGQTSGQIAPADVDALAEFLQATGWSVLYGVNCATSTPQAAAAEVAYAVKALGNNLYGIEIGNEPDLYGSYFNPWNLSLFETRWEGFRTAVLSQSPNVVLTGPACFGNVTSWTIPFGQTVGKSQLNLLTQHYYRQNGSAPTIALMLSPDPTLKQDLAELNQGAQSIGIPFRISETNAFDSGGAPGVSDSYASALWILDYFFEIALAGGAGANVHRQKVDSPIADNNYVVVGATPQYYGMRFLTMAGQGNLLGTTVSAGGLNVTAYAVQLATGGLNVVVINKDETQNLKLGIQVSQQVSAATLLQLTGPSSSATTGMAIQGATIDVDGSLATGAPQTLTTSGSQVSCNVPAISAALIQIQ
jgi:hypothetical protein